LRTSLLSSAKNAPIKTILITSAEPEEGKTTIIANLASCIAETGKNVLIMDTDLYCPKIHEMFNLRNNTGLSQILNGDGSFGNSIQRSQRNDIKILTSGPPIANQSELLGSTKMDTLLGSAKDYFDFIFLDTPAFSAIVDAAYLIPKVDFVLIVSKLGQAREPTLKFTLQQIKNLGADFIGLIVNNTEARIPSRYIKYYQQMMSETGQEKHLSKTFVGENQLMSTLANIFKKSRRQIDKVLNHHIPFELPMKIDEDLKE
jgi:capsular exopolysaccharide synthesis family protein